MSKMTGLLFWILALSLGLGSEGQSKNCVVIGACSRSALEQDSGVYWWYGPGARLGTVWCLPRPRRKRLIVARAGITAAAPEEGLDQPVCCSSSRLTLRPNNLLHFLRRCHLRQRLILPISTAYSHPRTWNARASRRVRISAFPFTPQAGVSL